MSKPTPLPSELNLHQKSRILEVIFDDQRRFELPCEYLRISSPSVDARIAEEQDTPLTGKEWVNITAIEPMGHYAVRIRFDDGHSTGVYSWETLYQLGCEQESRWAKYLDALARIGYQRRTDEHAEAVADGKRSIKILYFVTLVEKLGRSEESLALDAKIKTVADLLALLRKRSAVWNKELADDAVQVTINRQFATLHSYLENAAELGLVPKAKN